MAEQSRDVATPEDAARPVLTAAAVRKTPSRERQTRPRGPAGITGEDRRQMIAEAAYFRAVERGFAPGREVEDWLAAEMDVDALLENDDSRV